MQGWIALKKDIISPSFVINSDCHGVLTSLENSPALLVMTNTFSHLLHVQIVALDDHDLCLQQVKLISKAHQDSNQGQDLDQRLGFVVFLAEIQPQLQSQGEGVMLQIHHHLQKQPKGRLMAGLPPQGPFVHLPRSISIAVRDSSGQEWVGEYNRNCLHFMILSLKL